MNHKLDTTVVRFVEEAKYHRGAATDREFDGRTAHLSLTSHVEISDPLAFGKARAKRDQSNDAVERGWWSR